MATVITWLDEVGDRSGRVVEVDLVDEDGNSITPKTAKFTLTDGNGEIVNGREDVDITPLSSTLKYALGDEDTAAGSDINGRTRFFVLKATYDSENGSDLPLNACCAWRITDFPQT